MMFIKHFNQHFILIGGLAFILLGGLITACGSSDNTGSTQTGTVALLLTDGPTEEFSQVNVTVNEVSLLSDERGPVILFSGERRIDLLALQEVEDLLMIHEGVPAGIYNKIRLRVSDPEFVRNDGAIITSDQIHLVADGKVDLVPGHPFQVLPGETLILRLDLDAEKSILIHLSSESTYEFRPVVFVEVLDKLLARVVFVDGEIESINAEAHSFLLRRSHPIFHDLDLGDNLRHLIRVVVADDTRIFEATGLPGSFDSLAVGQHVNVRGFFSLEDGFHIQAQLIEIGKFIRLHGLITQGVEQFMGPVCDHFIFQPDLAQGIIGNIEVRVHDRTLIFEAGTHQELKCEALVTGRRVIIEGVLDVGQEPDLLHAAVIIVRPDKAELTQFEGTIHDLNLEARTFNLAIILPCEPLCLPIFQQIILVHVLPDAVIIRIHRKEDGHLEIEPIPFDLLNEGDRVHVFGQFDVSGSPFHASVVVVEAERTPKFTIETTRQELEEITPEIRAEGHNIVIIEPMTLPDPCHVVEGSVIILDNTVTVELGTKGNPNLSGDVACIQVIVGVVVKVTIFDLPSGTYSVNLQTPQRMVNATIKIE